MGYGDEIMVTGEVKRRAAGKMRRFAIRDPRKGGRQRWHEIWLGNPRIAAPGMQFDEWIDNCGGYRPYIEFKGERFWKWRPYKPEPGEIFLQPVEAAFAKLTAGKILIQPTIKDGASPAKRWAWRNWEILVSRAPSLPWTQIGPASDPRIGVPFIETRTFREACGALSGAKAAVLHEGGLHHAAAAFGVRSVVIYGGFISPLSTGYDLHKNIFEPEEHPLGCGSRFTCYHCERAMERITPPRVLKSLEELLS